MDEENVIAFAYLADDDDISEMKGCDLYQPEKDEHFFNTRDEALSFKEHLKSTYRSKIKEIAPFIEMLDDISSEEFNLGSYLPIYERKESWREKEYEKKRDVINILVKAIRTGFLNISGECIKTSEVVRIKWYKKGDKRDYCAGIITKDGEEVRTHDEAEYDVIEYIFGGNTSGKYYMTNK